MSAPETPSPGKSTVTPGWRRPLINRNFALLWSGQAISVLGDFTFSTTLVLWVVTLIARGQPWAPEAVSGILLATILPEFVVAPAAGVFADRWNKRRTMLRMDAMRAVLVALLVLATGVVPLPFLPGGHIPVLWQLGAIYGITFVVSVCSQFFNPSMFALIAGIVDEPDRARASGLKQAASSLAAILGPSLAAPLFFVAGIQWALLLNALSFAVSFLAVLAMRAPAAAGRQDDEPHEGFLRELAEGLRFYAGNRVLVTLLLMNVLALVGYGTVNTLDIFFLTQNLRAPANLYGLLASAQGVGLVAGAALAAAFAQRVGVARVLGFSVAAWGIAVVVFARLTSFAPALVLIGLIGFMVSASQVAETPILMNVTPQALLGRVAAVLTPALSASELLGIGLSGFLASTALRHFHTVVLGVAIGPIDTIFTVVGLSILAAGVYTLINLRGVKLARAGAPESAGPPPT